MMPKKLCSIDWWEVKEEVIFTFEMMLENLRHRLAKIFDKKHMTPEDVETLLVRIAAAERKRQRMKQSYIQNDE